MSSSRADLGLPKNWSHVDKWFTFSGPISVDYEYIPQKPSKWPKIPVLSDYSVPPAESFWDLFPKKELPSEPETSIDIVLLESKIQEHSHLMTSHQLDRSLKAVSYLRHGAPSFQLSELKACNVPNSKSTLVHGRAVTEEIATWLSEGYAAGPFIKPPCESFRVNLFWQ